MSAKPGRGRTGRAARAQRRDVAEQQERQRRESGRESGPRQALTHRMTGLADHPLAQGLATSTTAPEPEPKAPAEPAVVRCTQRSDRGGSIGPCGGMHLPDHPCPRVGTHIAEREQ